MCLSMLVRRFNFELATTPEEVGMTTGATIHTKNGLKVAVTRRNLAGKGSGAGKEAFASA